MTYYDMKDWNFEGFIKSNKKGKMYSAILKNKNNGKIKKLDFGDSTMQNYRDITGLNLYPHLIHNDKRRRRLFQARHKGFLKKNMFSPSFFSYYFLW